jgi:hypothetical protein
MVRHFCISWRYGDRICISRLPFLSLFGFPAFLDACLSQPFLGPFSGAAPTPVLRDGCIVVLGLLSSLHPESLGNSLRIMAPSPPSQFSRHVLERSASQPFLRILHGLFQRSDFVFVRAHEARHVEFAIWIRGSRSSRPYAVLRFAGESRAFLCCCRCCTWGELPLLPIVSHHGGVDQFPFPMKGNSGVENLRSRQLPCPAWSLARIAYARERQLTDTTGTGVRYKLYAVRSSLNPHCTNCGITRNGGCQQN